MLDRATLQDVIERAERIFLHTATAVFLERDYRWRQCHESQWASRHIRGGGSKYLAWFS